MKKNNDRWLRIILPFVLIVIAMYNGQTLVPPYTYAKFIYALYSIVCFTISFEVSRLIILEIRQRFPYLQQTRKRLVIVILFVISAVYVLKIANYIVYRTILDSYVLTAEIFIGFALETIIVAAISIGLYEALYFYMRFLRAEKEKEQLLRANVQSQLDGLKTQVNPHFLFNSLNSLTALISKDPVKAERFVEEMSGVYRYLLKNNIEDLTTLREELHFIRSYLHMQETRFGKGLQYLIDINDEYNDLLLPPLTLQMLVENAIKHNIVTLAAPLKIVITTNDEGQLVVKNNLQKKYRRVVSGKVGLANIISKYRLLNAEEIEVEENEKEFIVSIPLIKKHEPENSYH